MIKTEKEFDPYGWYGFPRYGYPVITERKAPHIGHRQHLCDIALRGDVSLEHIKNMVRDAKFICNKCGRAAVKEDNLCEPRTLQPVFKT